MKTGFFILTILLTLYSCDYRHTNEKNEVSDCDKLLTSLKDSLPIFENIKTSKNIKGNIKYENINYNL